MKEITSDTVVIRRISAGEPPSEIEILEKRLFSTTNPIRTNRSAANAFSTDVGVLNKIVGSNARAVETYTRRIILKITVSHHFFEKISVPKRKKTSVYIHRNGVRCIYAAVFASYGTYRARKTFE